MALLTFFLAGVITDNIMHVGSAALALRVLALAIFLFAIAGDIPVDSSRNMRQGWFPQRLLR
ncbi:MAG: hypothetical protein V8S12_03920 [Lachnospiraceae bacterium]